MDTIKTEADMGYVRDFVQLIAEALVSATELPKQIEAMKNDLATLHSDLDRTKARNMELDTLTADLRRQRDEAEQALSWVKAELGRTDQDFERTVNESNGLKAQLDHFRSELEKAKQERDDYGLKHMAAEDRASEAEAKLDKLREAMGIPKPEPKAEPVPVAEPVQVSAYAQPAPITPSYGSAPAMDAIPEAVPAPTRIYEGQYGFTELSHSTEQWDNVTQRYYRTA